MSAVIAATVADELRKRGLAGTRPAPPGELDSSGAERRIAGGIGAKRVDVSWCSEESGLILAVSVKTINFKDSKSKTFQKNLPNRSNDMLFDSVTLHRRFPYAVLVGLFVLDAGAKIDGTRKRASTFENAHKRLAIFSGRNDPGERDEKYERLYLVLLDSTTSNPTTQFFPVGQPEATTSLDTILNDALGLVAERNSDFYEVVEGVLLTSASAKTKSNRRDAN
ncbi:MAG: hypothetical protein H7Y88_12595 [Phycisphaerales bacterium]|nr:hypothetical protein [Phycisphaerales bacterium]